MASLLERMNLPSSGPVRSRGPSSSRSSTPYSRTEKTPKGNVEEQWTHDLYDTNSLSARLSTKPVAPKANLNTIAQKALREASVSAKTEQLSIKGASTQLQGNVVEVTGLVHGTTAEDVKAIFKRCGEVTGAKSVSATPEVRIRVTFKTAQSATAAVQKFNNQPADGKVLSVRIVGSANAGTGLSARLGGIDGLGLVREEGSVDILMATDADGGSKMRSDSLLNVDPRAHVLVAPPGANPADYVQSAPTRGGRRGGFRGARGARQGRRDNGKKMDTTWCVL